LLELAGMNIYGYDIDSTQFNSQLDCCLAPERLLPLLTCTLC